MRFLVATIAVAAVLIAALLVWERADRECEDFATRDAESVYFVYGKPWWC